MLGAIIGDIVGSIYEFDNHLSKEFVFFGEDARFTDDTVCTVALASALLDDLPPDNVLQSWCLRYPDRDYGGMFAWWLSLPKMAPYNSFGNGAAMRVSGAAWLANSFEHALILCDRITEITHNHEEGFKGARATCQAIYTALNGAPVEQIRMAIHGTYGYDLSQSIDEIRSSYLYNETCQDTVPQAITCALNASDFEDAIRNAISIGGDSDTIAAITGSIAEPLFGIPETIANQATRFLPEEFKSVIARVGAHRKYAL
ncbi:ADP-ribosylglycohydrolase family protein [Ferrovum myxofaciens]|jgi:ADP-ribosylglycohydrolase|uniref:ADP-ribosylglycohydrolase family protein n=1 Tax=Ferrovum myxofaciens TaxID=416213 RepID=UPI0004E12CC0|nr:ADP-ribosylglycohydrolase family protein [Ferrovum myxofaciens]